MFLQYTLMHKNKPVLDLDIHLETATILKTHEIYDIDHLPIGIKVIRGKPDNASLNSWWQGRFIPASRMGLREALEMLSVPIREQLVLKSFGLSLSDHYWINDKKHPLKYSDINFFENKFSDDVGNALFGIHSDSDQLNLTSPDNTSDGWLKKKWKIIDGKRYLVKSGSDPFMQEPLNERFATIIQNKLGYEDVIDYGLMWENDKPYSVCENFITTSTELVSAFNISKVLKKENNISSYDHFVKCCDTLGIPNTKQFLDRMLALDFIIANTDRHLNNFGAVRNPQTLDWIGFAPIFDCGTAMWHNKLTNGISFKSDESKPFKNTHSEQIKLINNYEQFDFDKLSEVYEECYSLYKLSPYMDEQRCMRLSKTVNQRISFLRVLSKIKA